jgi:hypothetical protein
MTPTDDDRLTRRTRLGRALARALVIAGAAFWVIAAFACPYVYPDVTLAASARTALWPFLATVLILVLGWKHGQLAAVLLSGAAAAVVVWGVIYSWKAEAWLFMTAILIVPMVVAAVLFAFSSRTDERPPAG